MNATYSITLVITSVLVAIAASYAALDLAGLVTASHGRARYAWLAGGSMAMGVGIWSMHFVAMLAFHLPVPIAYDLPLVLLSAAVAIAASLLALFIVSRPAVGVGSILAGGALMGPAIAGMHYIGMAAIRVPSPVSYDAGLVALSVAIAITASCAALWLAFRFRRAGTSSFPWGKAISAVVMGFAIAGMHYTAMAAAHFGPMDSRLAATDEYMFATPGLAAAVITGSLIILGIALVGGMVDRRFQHQKQIVNRLASVLDETTDYAGTADAGGKLLYLNKAGRAMLGIGRDEDITGLTLIDVYPPSLRASLVRDIVPQVIRDGVWSGETFFLHRDGKEIPVSLVGLAHKSPDGEVEFLSSVARDISDQVAIRKALEDARADAERTGAAKIAFLANMSHEIRTPLNGIMGMLELLLDTDLSPVQRREADLMSISADSLLSIVNDVLDLSKIEAGQLELEKLPFDLHGLVDSAVRLHAVGAAERGIELLYDMPADVPTWVRGDPGRLRQVLANLIGNAVKFTHQGEVVLRLSRQGATNGHASVRFSVKDTGIGISLEHVETIFQPFKQADASTTRKYGGTGLGLSIARRLVNLMGGEIGVTSEPGKGTEFVFELALPVEQHVPLATDSSSSAGVLHDARVLVVDDNATNRRLVRDMLSMAGCAVADAPDAVSGLDKLRQGRSDGAPFNLLITDLLMPGRDGFDLAATVRGDLALADTRIMMLTSAGRLGDGQRARELGVAAYLLKPISRVELLDAVITVLRKAGADTPGALVTRSSIEETRQVRRILVAEDNPVNQQVVSSMLRKRGHHVDIVGNGREAVDAVLRTPYDLVLMDIQMPELDGLSATHEIRKALGGPPLPIIAVTASALPEERQRCLAGGMDGYLVKPFKAHELFAAVESWGTVRAEREPVATPAGEGPPVDVAAFRVELRDAGVEAMVVPLLDTFLGDAAGRLEALELALKAGEADSIMRAAHAYKSAAGTIHAASLADALREIEVAGSSGDLAEAGRILPRVRREHAAIIAYLNSEAAPSR